MTTEPLFREKVLLKDHCTFGIGGPARYFVEVKTIDDMCKTVNHCHKKNIPFMVIGKGSNCLFDDKGFNGAVILNKIDFFEETPPGTFHVGGGYSFALLGVQTARKGWSGLEFASGIPATVGGAVFMNAGANGSETCQALASVDFVSEDGTLQTIKREDMTFAYRSSPFQKMKGAIVGATFALKADSEARKKQIEIVTYRKNTQPYGSMSAGCVFLNPACGHAGALIDKCQLKGKSVGGAQVSQLHANFLINAGNATCKDIQALIELVQQRVKESTGVDLHNEVRYIPYESEGR